MDVSPRGERLSEHGGRALAAGLLLLLAVTTVAAAAGVDPFYRSLMRDGQLAYERGDFLTAAKRFRLASFGFLDDPPLLVEGLVRLAMSQIELGDDRGFRETFNRILEIEDRFDAYPESQLTPSFRQRFEEEVRARLPSHYLETSPAFAHLASAPTAAEPEESVDRVAELPPRRRSRELERRIASDPENPEWFLMLARTELELRRHRPALAAAQTTLELDPDAQEAICIRGRAYAALENCALAVADLEACPASRSVADAAADLLGCYLVLEDHEAARELLATLPEAVLAERAVARLARRTPAATAAEADVTESPMTSGGEGLGHGSAPAASDANGGVETVPPVAGDDEGDNGEDSTALRAERLEAARALLSGARTVEALEQAAQLVQPIADSDPGDSEAQLLAAEIAYRASRWEQAAHYFSRAGDPGDERPRLLFYMAVSYYEIGRQEQAAAILRRCAGRLQRSPYVESYIDRILGPSG